MSDKAEIQKIAESLGANPLEVVTILGIAFAESNYEFGAKGDYRSDGSYYSHGAFQAERQAGVSPKQQVKTALDRIRQQLGYLKPIFGELASYVENSDQEILKYMKANWQVGVTKSKNWINYIEGRIEDITTYTSIDEDGIRVTLAGENRKLDVNDFIDFLDDKGASRSALQGGQDLISQYIDREMPSITVAGVTGWGMGLAILLGIALFWWFKK